MSKELQLKEINLKEIFDDLDTILDKRYCRKTSSEFHQIVKDTLEDVKTKRQMHNNLTNELSLEIDRAFDDYIERKDDLIM